MVIKLLKSGTVLNNGYMSRFDDYNQSHLHEVLYKEIEYLKISIAFIQA